MQFSNYTDFRIAVLKFIDGDDVNTSSLDQNTLDLMIAMGEQRVYYGDNEVTGLRCGPMETAFTGTVTSGVFSLPSDCLELKAVWINDYEPLEWISEDEYRRVSRYASGPARRYSQQGETLVFYPGVANGTAVGGRYYRRFPDIKTGGLNAAFNRYPEVFLFAALAEAAPFIGEDARMPMWRGVYQERLRAANRIEKVKPSEGSRLTQRAR